jgi:hypothetical protein
MNPIRLMPLECGCELDPPERLAVTIGKHVDSLTVARAAGLVVNGRGDS